MQVSLEEGSQPALSEHHVVLPHYHVNSLCRAHTGSGKSRDIQIGHVTSYSSLKIRHMAIHVTRVQSVGPQLTSRCLSRDNMSCSRGRGLQ